MSKTHILLPERYVAAGPHSLHARYANEDYEVQGAFLYRPCTNGDGVPLAPVELFVQVGSGSSGRVQPHEHMRSAVNRFFAEHPGYRAIHFHTHSQGTLDAHGSGFAERFSTLDRTLMDAERERNPHYLALLLTPARLLSYPDGTPVHAVRDDRLERAIPSYADARRTARADLARAITGGAPIGVEEIVF